MTRYFVQYGVAVALLFVLAIRASAQSEAQANYAAKCQACHGTTGAGETPTGKMLKVKSFNDTQVKALNDEALTGTISSGSGKMPSYQNEFSGDQIAALVQYLHQLQTNLQGN